MGKDGKGYFSEITGLSVDPGVGFPLTDTSQWVLNFFLPGFDLQFTALLSMYEIRCGESYSSVIFIIGGHGAQLL